jgi:hypothetical protein
MLRKVRSKMGYVIRIFEPIHVRLFENWPEGDCRSGPQFLWLLSVAYDPHQGIRQIVVDNGRIACQFGGHEPVGLWGPTIIQNLLKHLPGIAWPVPWRCVYQSLKVHFGPLLRSVSSGDSQITSRAKAHPCDILQFSSLSYVRKGNKTFSG